ncbi:hypothetical protein Tco_0483378 [Tanacetum coccineum]
MDINSSNGNPGKEQSAENTGGSILELMDELVACGQAMGYSMDGCTKDIEFIIGGMACIWDPNRFILDHVSKSDYFVALMGTWTSTSTKLLIISIYAPQELSEKRDLWEYLCILITRWDGETIIMYKMHPASYRSLPRQFLNLQQRWVINKEL